MLKNFQGVKVLTQNLPGTFAVKIAPILAETASCRQTSGGKAQHHASPLPSTLLKDYLSMMYFLIVQLLIPKLLLRRPQIPLLTHTKIILAYGWVFERGSNSG